MSQLGVFRIEKDGQRNLISPIGEKTIIGRSASAQAYIPEKRCDQIHAIIVKNDSQLKLIDLGSHYGTYLGKKRISEVEIGVNDSFYVGNTCLAIDYLEKHDQVQKNPVALVENQTKKVTPQGEKQFLQLTKFWGEVPLDIMIFEAGSEILVGPSREADVEITLPQERLQKGLLKVAQYNLDSLKLFIPKESTGIIWKGAEVTSLDALRHKDKKTDGFEDLEIQLTRNDKAYIQIADVGLQFEFVERPEKIKVLQFKWNKQLAKILALILAFWALVIGILAFSEVEHKEQTLEDLPENLKQVVYDAGIQEALKKQKAAVGQIAQNLEGGRARAEEGASKAQKAMEQSQAQAKQKQAEAVKSKTSKLTAAQLEAAFAGAETSENPVPDSVKGPTETGNTVSALSEGGYARGSKGLGAGGGGQSVGVGQLTGMSVGGGMGAGDYGLNPSKGSSVKVPQTEEIVTLGGLDPEIIAAVIKRYLSQIQYCYEQQLLVNPKLKGKVLVSFIIDGSGATKSPQVVESSLRSPAAEKCMMEKIKGWKFPKPLGGGSVGVKYPFMLMSNTGE